MAAVGAKAPLGPVACIGPSYGLNAADGQASTQKASSALIGLPAVCLCILVVELCERLAFYTFTGTQEFYLERRGYSLAQAGGLNAAMSTLCMAWAIVAGWVADVGLGRYQTIVAFGFLYVIGALVATAAAWPAISSSKWYLVGVLLLVPMGTAGIKANISNFGADQYDTNDPAQLAAQEKFFSWFYMAINLGSAVAYGYLTTMGSNGGLGVPANYGYFAVYLIASLCMLIAVGLFVSGKPHYRMQAVQPRSALGGVTRHVTSAARRGSPCAASVCAGVVLLTLSVMLSVMQALLPDHSGASLMTGLAFVFALVGVLAVVVPCSSPTWIGSQQPTGEPLPAADVKEFLRLLPVLFTANLAFSALYNSMQFWYQQQACQMDLSVPFAAKGTQFAGSFFMIADCLGIVLATPLALAWINPSLEKHFGAYFGHSAKFGLGMGFALLSVLTAAYLEVDRRRAPISSLVSNCAPDGVRMSDLSAAWMVFPFFLMGIGEIYTQPVIMHFAYTCSPPSMRTMTAAMSLVIGAVSNALFTVQISALSRFVPNDLNKGHLEYGYYMNIILGTALYACFIHALNGMGSLRSA